MGNMPWKVQAKYQQQFSSWLWLFFKKFVGYVHQEKKGHSFLLSWSYFYQNQSMQYTKFGHSYCFKLDVCVGTAGEEQTTEPPRMQPGLGPSVHMELKNRLRHRQRGQADRPHRSLWGLIFQPKMGAEVWCSIWFELCSTEFYLSLIKLTSSLRWIETSATKIM